MTTYGTLPDVELVSAGMAWRGNADWYVTAEHLADMVAAQGDPLIRAPRVKLGHLDALFGALAGTHDPTPDSTDGMPGFGTILNLRLTESGTKLVGDLTEVPDWLIEAMPSAYPTRSAEWIWDWETQGGHKYTAVLTDVALGSWRPAVEDLADVTREQATAVLQALLSAGPDAALAAAITTEEAPMGQSKPTGVAPAASVSQDRIVSAFEKWAWGEIDDGDHILGDPPPDVNDWYWAWCRDIRVDPDEIIASVEGSTWSVPFSTDGEIGVTFGTPIEVRETFLPVVAAASIVATAAQARHGQRVLASNLPRPQRPPKVEGASEQLPAPAATRPVSSEERTMDEAVRRALAAEHGLDPATATEADVNAAVLAAANAPAPDPAGDDAPTSEAPADPATLAPAPGTTPTPASTPAPAPAEPAPATPPVDPPIVTPPVTPPPSAVVTPAPTAEPATEPDRVPVATSAAVGPETVPVSREVWDETQTRLGRLESEATARETAATTTRRDGKADGWVRSGRITPAERALARANLDINEEATTKAYDALAAGRTPVEKDVVVPADTTTEDALYLASCARMGHTPNTSREA